MTTSLIEPNSNYTLMAPELLKVRTCVAGSPFVKRAGTALLSHPSDADQVSDSARARYQRYKDNALFVEIPSQTEKSIVGKLKADDVDVVIPDALDYLISDVDKDGLTLVGLIESLAGEQLEAKWSVLVSDYEGLTDVDTASLSIADIEAIKPRATINQYTRENVVDWLFARVNGRMQLVYILLKEESQEFDYNESASQATKTDVVSYLKLALDEDGDYYQQKIVTGADSKGYEEGERNYPLINKKPLQFLPVSVVSDEEFTGSDMPLRMGYLAGICDLTLARYRMDAEYREVIRQLKPTTYITGVDGDQFVEQFKACNQGRDYIQVFGVNIIPSESATVSITSADDHTKAFITDKEVNEKEIRALGGVFPSDDMRQRTLGEAILENVNLTNMLNPMVSALEQGLETAIGYCAMFEGLVSPDDLMAWIPDNIEINMPRDFALQKMSVEERKALREDVMLGLITKETALKLMAAGGIELNPEEELAMLELQAPRVTGQPVATSDE